MSTPRELAWEAVCEHDAVQLFDELAALAGLLPRRPRRVLEIGSEFGGTLWLWSQLAAEGARIVSVDLSQAKNTTEARPGQDLLLLEGDSTDPATKKSAMDFLGGPADFIFIDGDHEYDGVKSDWVNYSPLVADDGLIALHDVCCLPPVAKFWAELEGQVSRLTITVDHVGIPGWSPGIGVVLEHRSLTPFVNDPDMVTRMRGE